MASVDGITAGLYVDSKFGIVGGFASVEGVRGGPGGSASLESHWSSKHSSGAEKKCDGRTHGLFIVSNCLQQHMEHPYDA